MPERALFSSSFRNAGDCARITYLKIADALTEQFSYTSPCACEVAFSASSVVVAETPFFTHSALSFWSSLSDEGP
jgi:hypothetical protein